MIKEIAIKLLRAYVGKPATNITASTNHTGGGLIPRGGHKKSGGQSYRGLNRYEDQIILDHHAIRQNTRSIIHNSTQARIIVKRKTDVVVGPGLKPSPAPAWNILGITQDAAKEWGDTAKEHFNLWANSKDSDLTGINNFYQNQSFTKWQHGRDGEYFIRLTYSDNPALINPVQISFIDPNQIRGDEFTFSSGPQAQEAGIITDENGKATAYKVWISDPNHPGRHKSIEIPAFDEKTGRPIMIHGYNPEWVGQKRGIPEISHGLQDFQDVTKFDSATLKRASAGASMGFTVENEMQTPSDMGMSDITEGESAGSIIDQAAQIPRNPNIDLGLVTTCQLSETTQTETGPVNLFAGQQGDKLKSIPNNSPDETTGTYIDGKFKYLAAFMSMPFTVAVMQMGKAHSASRAELGMLADVIKIEINDLASDALSPIWGAVISEEIAAGRMQAPGFSDPILRAAWLNLTWTGTPLPDVDPLKTRMADKLAAELGATDLDRIAMEYNGSNGESNRMKLSRQLDELVTDPYGIKALEQDAKIVQKIEADDKEEEAENEE
jgi:lambda family phage portal protein